MSTPESTKPPAPASAPNVALSASAAQPFLPGLGLHRAAHGDFAHSLQAPNALSSAGRGAYARHLAIHHDFWQKGTASRTRSGRTSDHFSDTALIPSLAGSPPSRLPCWISTANAPGKSSTSSIFNPGLQSPPRPAPKIAQELITSPPSPDLPSTLASQTISPGVAERVTTPYHGRWAPPCDSGAGGALIASNTLTGAQLAQPSLASVSSASKPLSLPSPPSAQAALRSVFITAHPDSGCTGSLTPHHAALVRKRPCAERFKAADGKLAGFSPRVFENNHKLKELGTSSFEL